MELLDMSVEELGASMAELQRIQPGGAPRNARREENLKAWLSAALGNQDTCIEGFEATDGRIRNSITGSLRQVGSEFPTWIGEEERGLVRMEPGMMHVDAVVAQDGSGRYRTIMAAVEEAPDHGERRYVIYVKRGVYRENVELKKKKSNIMMVGEGMGLTVVSSGRNFLQGWTTYRTATFAVSGRGFIARDMTFRNTAGPGNRQAVALRVDSDRSAFFRCSIEGYQGHPLRPLPPPITITAQGRKDPNQATGFSIQKCFVYATVPTYLGRPWKPYSRTVFMQTYMSGMVQPEGWLEWAGNFGLNTLYYGEYTNYGPGAGTGGRVRWAGYHVIRDARMAAMFTVRRFIDGGSWLPSTGVIFTAGLTK
ncbi:putative pectinesterase/pectinesterase inhibitor 22 [Acorus calamus]|uniref:Pectinesterase n=1 Tax=Acorus calamus TaxID=4465 RepID=A0AAV9D1P1_ACOCL|nr:putative pectinesterase/pectinesterase inhibitor 22 [Acorus calamus]